MVATAYTNSTEDVEILEIIIVDRRPQNWSCMVINFNVCMHITAVIILFSA